LGKEGVEMRSALIRWTTVAGGVLAAVGALAVSSDGARASSRVQIHARSPWGGGAFLGVVLEEVGPEDVGGLRLPEERGALVKEVTPETPAARAGLKAGDVVLSYQGETVQSATQLARLVRETPVGRKVALEVSREGSIQKLTATLSEDAARPLALERALKRVMPRSGEGPSLDAPEPPGVPLLPEDFGQTLKDELLSEQGHLRKEMDRLRIELGGGSRRRLGIRYQELDGQLAGYFKVEKGLLVTEVDADSPAGKAGLRAGDVILKVNGRAVESSGDLRAELRKIDAGSEAGLTLQRDGRPVDVKVIVGGESGRRERVSRPTV
jgi:serine protease Do